MDPAHLITIGVFGAACFVLVAVVGVVWQQSVGASTQRRPVSTSATIAAPVRPAPPAKPVAKIEAPVQDTGNRQEVRTELGRYINGPLVDLLSDLEQLQSNWEAEAVKDNTSEALLQKLQIMRQRIRGSFSNLDALLKKHNQPEIKDITDWSAPASLDSSLGELIRVVQAAPDPDRPQQTLQGLSNHPASTHFSIAVGELSIWVQQKRSAIAAHR